MTLHEILERAPNGLLAPSEVARLGVCLERAMSVLQSEFGDTRARTMEWLEDDEDPNWSPE